MEIIRKSIKAVFISFMLFVLLTFVFAMVIYITDNKEAWSYEMMLISVVISSMFAGILEAKIVGRRMLFVFLIATVLFAIVLYGSVYMIFCFK